jgi:DNA-binding response OmpR family regulator
MDSGLRLARRLILNDWRERSRKSERNGEAGGSLGVSRVARRRHRHSSIIALTGWGHPDDKARSTEAGCNAHLVKPVNMRDLNDVLDGFDKSLPASNTARSVRVTPIDSGK